MTLEDDLRRAVYLSPQYKTFRGDPLVFDPPPDPRRVQAAIALAWRNLFEPFDQRATEDAYNAIRRIAGVGPSRTVWLGGPRSRFGPWEQDAGFPWRGFGNEVLAVSRKINVTFLNYPSPWGRRHPVLPPFPLGHLATYPTPPSIVPPPLLGAADTELLAHAILHENDFTVTLLAHTCRAGPVWMHPSVNVAILPPTEKHFRSDSPGEPLHRDGGPAIVWPDGTKRYILNGIEVSEYLATTPAGQLDASRLAVISNVDHRREFVRKIGIERIWTELGANVIDTLKTDVGGEYTLAELAIPDGGAVYREVAWRVLRMENQSVPELWHVEAVPPTCGTVLEALNFRNGLTEDQIDDENGAEWFQQGDILLKRKGATKFKRFPTILT